MIEEGNMMDEGIIEEGNMMDERTKEDRMNEMLDDLSDASSDNENEVQEEYEESIDDNRKMKRSEREKVKKADPGYFKYMIERKDLKVKVEVYSTRTHPGSLIRCPFTGIRYSEVVGSEDENLFFKVKMPCISDGKDGVTLYYSSPESFERHHLTILSKDVKKSWLDKKKIYEKKKLEKEDRKYRSNITIH